MVITINKTSGKWLLNDKPYVELVGDEKEFFDEFLIAMRLEYGCEQYDKLNNNTSKTN